MLLERDKVLPAVLSAQKEIIDREGANGLSIASARIQIADQNLESEPGWHEGDPRVIGILDFIFK